MDFKKLVQIDWKEAVHQVAEAFSTLTLFKKKEHYLALDITDTRLKCIELFRKADQLCVKNYAVSMLPIGAVVEKEIRRPEDVTEAAERLLKRINTKAKMAILALPTSAAITKTISVDASLTHRELELEVQLEAEKYLAQSLDDLNIDFTPLGVSERNPNMQNVFLVACNKSNLELRVASIESAGLLVGVVDVEPYAIERAYTVLRNQIPDTLREGRIAILDIGAEVTSLVVLDKSRLVYAHDELFGSEQLTRNIQQKYQLSHEQAELAKITGNLPADYKNTVLETFHNNTLQLMQRLLQLFYSSVQYDDIDYLLLAGGAANTEGLKEVIAKNVACPVALANPLLGMNIDDVPHKELLWQEASGLTSVVGLALRGLVP